VKEPCCDGSATAGLWNREPDLSPIEPGWSRVETALCAAKPHTRMALDTAITGALVTVTSSDAQGWFRHCDYALR
jgi:hypothetical protein